MKNFFFLFVLILFSCGPKPEKGIEVNRPLDKCIIEKIFSDEESDFGKYSIGMTRTAFQDFSNTYNLIQTEDEVIDSIPLCGNKNSYCEASFIFLNARLTDITATFFIESEEMHSQIYPLIEEKLNEKYGTALSDQGTSSWQVEKNGKPFSVYLSDETLLYNRPVIKLLMVSEGKVPV